MIINGTIDLESELLEIVSTSKGAMIPFTCSDEDICSFESPEIDAESEITIDLITEHLAQAIVDNH